MRRINCYIPIKLCITGHLADPQLEQLSDALVRTLSARIAFAERTINPGHAVSATVIVDPAREPIDVERFHNQTYSLPSFNNRGRNTGVAVLPSGSSTTQTDESEPELPLLSDFHYYAFFFTGGAYGHAAEEYIREFYPDHHRFQARSFEEMFHLLLVDIRRRTREEGRRQRVSEIVIVTHANAEGGMKIPLTQDNRRRVFTPDDLADLQQEFRRGLHRRFQFQAERREVVAALDESTRIVVRGCNLGQSQEALDSLRAFFGGAPTVFAPRGYQGFEVIPIGRSFLRTRVEAFDFLVQQGYLPADQVNLPARDKERYIRENFGDQIPAEFFVTSDEHTRRLRALPMRQRLGGGEAEEYMIRPDEHTAAPLSPSAGEFWGVSAALPRNLQPDPELDSLSMGELEARARALLNPYSPQNAALLIRLRDAWSRRSAETFFGPEDSSEPLSGLPDIRIFGDANILASDAVRFPGATRPRPDIFETETLPRRTRTADELARARDFTEEERTVEAVASAGVTRSRPKGFGSVGRVDTLPNGLRLWNFGSNSARLRSQFQTPLRQLAQQAAANPLLRFDVNGHTDSAGAPPGNERLSEQRALAVAQFLIDAGVPASRIRTRAFGESNLLAVERRTGGEVSFEGMARNRRVEILVTTLGGQTVDDDVLRGVRQQGATLGTQARPERIPGNYDSIDWYTVGGIATDVIAELSSRGYLAPAWELLAFAGPILNIIGLVDSISTAIGQQERGNRRRGIVLGLKAVGGLSRSTDLSANLSAQQLEELIHNDWWLEREWLSQITYSYPIGGEAAIENMRYGLRQVATRVNEGMRTVERYFRRRLEQTRMSSQDIETVYNHEIQRIRRQVLDEMLTAAFSSLGQ